MKKIKVKAVLSNLRVGETPIYRMIPENVTKVYETEFLERISAKMGQDVVQGRYWLDAFRDVLFQGLAKNESFELSFLNAKLHVTGSLSKSAEQPTKLANPVKPRIYLKGPLAEALMEIDVENDTLTVVAVMYELMQDGASDVNRIEAADRRIVINGSKIKIDPAQEDNGVWLENIKTGVKVAEATITHSDSATCHCSFATLPEAGKYRLVLATRNGESADAYALAKVTRNVFVVNSTAV